MSKRELINRIMDLNRSARREFLQSFNENDLADYLRQLESIRQPIFSRSEGETSNNY